ncbi:hypothetical protein BC628DRAFT_1342791 [Trametes gibbosa]|nr:hypothetical protein BC628DRAFT_1342791 [Trametes gibbosa]
MAPSRECARWYSVCVCVCAPQRGGGTCWKGKGSEHAICVERDGEVLDGGARTGKKGAFGNELPPGLLPCR